MLDACKIDDATECPNQPKFYYLWDWGQEGVCCDDHRGVLQTRSGQLGRGITFSTLGRGPRREYTPPQLRELPSDVGALQMKLAEHSERTKKLEGQITRLESEREKHVASMREQELRVQDLLKQNAELKAAVANAQLERTAALELATQPDNADAKGETREVIEGASEDAPPTQGKAKRRS